MCSLLYDCFITYWCIFIVQIVLAMCVCHVATPKTEILMQCSMLQCFLLQMLMLSIITTNDRFTT